MASGLQCGCQTFVNPNVFSRDAAAAVENEFAANACGEGVACGPCPSPPTQGYCAPNGQCADLQDSGERACKVGGVIYPSGSAGIRSVSSGTTIVSPGFIATWPLRRNQPLFSLDTTLPSARTM